MSATSSRRRQLDSYVPAPKQPKGPARKPREIDVILHRKRLLAALKAQSAQWDAELAQAQVDRARRLRRLVLIAIAAAGSAVGATLYLQ